MKWVWNLTELIQGSSGWALGPCAAEMEEQRWWAEGQGESHSCIWSQFLFPVYSGWEGKTPQASRANKVVSPKSKDMLDMLSKISEVRNHYTLFFFFFFGLFRAIPKAYGGSQARSLIRAITASLHHSHDKVWSKLCLWPTAQFTATPDP